MAWHRMALHRSTCCSVITFTRRYCLGLTREKQNGEKWLQKSVHGISWVAGVYRDGVDGVILPGVQLWSSKGVSVIV